MIKLVTSRGYQHHPAPGEGGRVVIQAPSSPLDGSLHECEAAALAAINHEQARRRSIVDADLASNGPLTQGLTLFAIQLQQLEWGDLDVEIDVAQGIAVFPGGQMLAIADAHRMLDELVVQGAGDGYEAAISQYQERLFERTAT
jgi:hypothetical protein